jgi:hypothetical protein
VQISIDKSKTIVKIPQNKSGLHFVQYKQPLTPERRFYFFEIINLGADSNVVLGIAPPSLLHDSVKRLPGECQDTIGYNSRNGLMYFNDKSHGNMMGHKCERGDSMAIEMEVFEIEMSVAIFSKNFKPVGTRFLTLKVPELFMPTIAIQSDGEPVELNVYWQTVVSMPPHFNVVT